MDLSLLAEYDYGHVVIDIDEDQKIQLKRFEQTYERAMSALYFALNIEVDSEQGNKNVKLGEAYLRASLCEFVSMEETLARDLRAHESDKKIIKIIKIINTSHPLICLLKEIRNMEVHLCTRALESEERHLKWGHYNQPNDAQSVKWNISFIENVTIDEFNQLNNSRHYNINEVQQSIAWFNKMQKQWGITEMILRGVQSYASVIIGKYC